MVVGPASPPTKAGPQSGRLCFFLVGVDLQLCPSLSAAKDGQPLDPTGCEAAEGGPVRSVRVSLRLGCLVICFAFGSGSKPSVQKDQAPKSAPRTQVIQYLLLFDVIRYCGLLLAFDSEHGIILCLIFLP